MKYKIYLFKLCIFHRVKIFFFLAFLMIQCFAISQDIYNNLETENSSDVVSFFNSIYNYNFVEAKQKKDKNFRGEHSFVEKELLNANYYWWLIISGENKLENHELCMYYLNLANVKLKSSNNKKLTESDVFSHIYIYAYKARLEIFNGRNLKALRHLFSSINYIEIAMENESQSDRYKFVAGLYNYFVAYIIEKYPIFYPYFFLFPKGDISKGLQQLKECSNSNDILVKTEAIYFLSKIYLEFENNYQLANEYCSKLTTSYKQNLIYRYYQFKSYLLLKDMENIKNEYYKLKIIAEKNYQLSNIQKVHLLEIAKLDLKQYNIIF